MYKLLLLPDADGYSSADGDEVLSVKLDGGAARYRRDKIGATKTVQVKWTLNPTQYAYWRAFYVTGTGKGSLPFLCDLVSEDGEGPVEHTCNFVPGSVSLPTQVGLMYVQQATLEVVPITHSTEADIAIINLFPEAPSAVFAELEYLVNVAAPGALPG
jgi:hypothetical protein